MPRETILVVDDEEDILELVDHTLSRGGLKVIRAKEGEEALDLVRKEKPSAVLLDLMLPGMDGLTVARLIKGDQMTRNIPIIMLTARGEEPDIVIGLEIGADDYVTKPFSPRVLLARVKAVLRRRSSEEPETLKPISVHNIVIDPGRHQVTVDDKIMQLTFTEFAILQFLAKRPGWVFTRSQIVDAVKGDDYFVTYRAVDVQIVGLRKKLGEAGSLIETVRGVGYRLRE
ncbi:MAG: DNA-binding response regulator [Deltaproteobacteria bacterium CG17_big_fil_post_rev_8_21_14_2_50_51_6]|nr:MAG: DNA-binding response regulator [Deltaproteobacteria bacterium CG17_big_fil_post_rev_8_21_14_2_50_51_6]